MLPIDLAGRVALVTGSSRGIGRAAALLLARAGCDVAVTAASHPEAGEAVVGEIRRLGRKSVLARLDVADTAAVEAAVAEATARLGPIDILVSNAGVGIAKGITEVSDAEHERIFAVNVKGLVATARAVAPGMKERRFGRIVAVSSVTGRSGKAFRSTAPTYSGAKAAIIGYVKGMARELGPFGITVNAVCPGWTDWEDAIGAKHGAAPDWLRAEAVAQIPLGRTGTAEDMAGAILYLASDLASYVTGVSLDVNGGLFIA